MYRKGKDIRKKDFCFWGEVSNSWILNVDGRNSLLGNRKKIAKFLMRTFTCRSTFLYAPTPFSPASVPLPPETGGRGHTSLRVGGWGESQFRRGAYTVVLFICTYFVMLMLYCIKCIYCSLSLVYIKSRIQNGRRPIGLKLKAKLKVNSKFAFPLRLLKSCSLTNRCARNAATFLLSTQYALTWEVRLAGVVDTGQGLPA